LVGKDTVAGSPSPAKLESETAGVLAASALLILSSRTGDQETGLYAMKTRMSSFLPARLGAANGSRLSCGALKKIIP